VWFVHEEGSRGSIGPLGSFILTYWAFDATYLAYFSLATGIVLQGALVVIVSFALMR
jgi:hypothetical protein